MKILMVLTSRDRLGHTGQKIGVWLKEFAGAAGNCGQPGRAARLSLASVTPRPSSGQARATMSATAAQFSFPLRVDAKWASAGSRRSTDLRHFLSERRRQIDL